MCVFWVVKWKNCWWLRCGVWVRIASGVCVIDEKVAVAVRKGNRVSKIGDLRQSYPPASNTNTQIHTHTRKRERAASIPLLQIVDTIWSTRTTLTT